MTKEKFWFKMGQTAFLEGLSIEDAMPYGSDTMMFVQFCAGWKYEEMAQKEQKPNPPRLPVGFVDWQRKDKTMDTTCKNCGGDKGLHHWQTMQCPFGGREAPIGKPDQWTASTFEPVTEQLAALTARVKELEGLLKQTHGELQRVAATGQKVDQGLLIEARAALRGEA